MIDTASLTQAAGLVPFEVANVRFFLSPMRQGAKSLNNGRPVQELVEHVEISFPGDKSTKYVGPVEQHHIHQYPTQYKAWKESGSAESTGVEGSLLTDWPLIPRALCERYNYFGVYTVEQLSALSASPLAKLGASSDEYQQKAKDWLALASKNADAMKLQTELRKRDERVKMLEEKCEKLIEQVTDLQTKGR